MRPKLVIVVFVLGIALLSVPFLLKTLRNSGDRQPQPEVPVVVPEVVTPSPTNPALAPVTSLVAMTPDEERAARVEKDLETLKNALLQSSDDPMGVFKALEKVTSPDSEVRKAAIEAVRHLNNREAIPRLKEALPRLEDPEDKVAVLETIKYLEMPDNTDEPPATADLPPGSLPFSSNTKQVDGRTVGRSNAPVRPK